VNESCFAFPSWIFLNSFDAAPIFSYHSYH
jgi:hypothetical protein